jgi:hypothetical protein
MGIIVAHLCNRGEAVSVVLGSLLLHLGERRVRGGINNVFICHLIMLKLGCTFDEPFLFGFLGHLGLGFHFMLLLDFSCGSMCFTLDSDSWVSLFVAHPGFHVMLSFRYFRHCNRAGECQGA